MNNKSWHQAIEYCHEQGINYAMVTILGCTGSTPRDQSSKMVVTALDSFDSIGGGHLEHKCIEKSQELLQQNCKSDPQVFHFPLGASLGQCCGGSATVLIELIQCEQMHVAVFGAGHVAQALMPILQGLPYKLTWIDQREYLFAHHDSTINIVVDEQPQDVVQDLISPHAILVLTHNHQLDFEICKQVLQHHPDSFLGVIGSQTKANRFRQRLAKQDFTQTQIEQMTCPVGLKQVTGKLPMEVAISISAQLIELSVSITNNFNGSTDYKQRGISHKQLLLTSMNPSL